MGVSQTPSSPPHLYPQALQLKLYQAFIFSIPILFSIILFLLFYLFYLKRRASSLTSQPVLPRTSNQATPYLASTCQMGLKGELRDKLPTVIFDEEIKTRGSQCCVCLGEYEFKEELLQVPSCKHVFHVECIHNWLQKNSTCPLCRCSVVPATMTRSSTSTQPSSPQHESFGPSPPLPPPPSGSSTLNSNSPGEVVIHTQGSSSGGTCLIESNGLYNTSTFSETNDLNRESVTLQIQTHDS